MRQKALRVDGRRRAAAAEDGRWREARVVAFFGEHKVGRTVGDFAETRERRDDHVAHSRRRFGADDRRIVLVVNANEKNLSPRHRHRLDFRLLQTSGDRRSQSSRARAYRIDGEHLEIERLELVAAVRIVGVVDAHELLLLETRAQKERRRVERQIGRRAQRQMAIAGAQAADGQNALREAPIASGGVENGEPQKSQLDARQPANERDNADESARRLQVPPPT